MVRTLTLGILAHVDAGKTSLTERLLHWAAVIDELGSVDDGSTQTDTLALERQRGITIRSAVVSFAIDDVAVNLIDTPGHPDFIAEVERVLGVLDGAVLVISAVEGVQAQTRVLMRVLQRLRLPTLIFVNKIDRMGARYESLLANISDKLSPAIVPMGTVADIGGPTAAWSPFAPADPRFLEQAISVLADNDDDLLAAYVAGPAVPAARVRAALAAQSRRAAAHPVFFGSAMTGTGVTALIAAIPELLPAAGGDPDAPVAGSVFKVERGPGGEKVAYVRMFGGSVRPRDRLRLPAAADPVKVTAVNVFDRGTARRSDAVQAGQIGQLYGLDEVRVGDAIGAVNGHTAPAQFSPPTLETVVVPDRPSDKGTLFAALTQLAEQDPLINVRRDERRQEVSVSLYGEVQKEVIQATLAQDYGVPVSFEETTTICVERLNGVGAAAESKSGPDNPFLATVGLRVAPGAGLSFALEVELGSMPLAFFKAVEETVTEALHQGLRGWPVIDCAVVMTHSGYYPKQSAMHASFDKSMSSTGWDFRYLTPLVLLAALKDAGTTVHEPIHRFHLEVPADALRPVLPVLAGARAVVTATTSRGGVYVVEGDIPAAQVHHLERRIPGLTSGEGVLESEFDRYRPVAGPPPARARTDHNPLNRKEYLLHVQRRV